MYPLARDPDCYQLRYSKLHSIVRLRSCYPHRQKNNKDEASGLGKLRLTVRLSPFVYDTDKRLSRIQATSGKYRYSQAMPVISIQLRS